MPHIPHHPRLHTLDIEASIEVLLTSTNFQSRSFSLSSCSHKLAEKNLCSDMHFTNITDMHLHVHACINMHFYSIAMCPQLARIMLWYRCNIPNTDIFYFYAILIEIVGHANCHAKFPYFIAEIRVRVCEIECTLTTDNWLNCCR